MKSSILWRLGMIVFILSLAVAPGSARQKKNINAYYTVTYDSFVNGALPVWIDRDYDEGAKIVTLLIQFDGEIPLYEDVYFYSGTTVQQTFNQYSGPGFVEVSVVGVRDM